MCIFLYIRCICWHSLIDYFINLCSSEALERKNTWRKKRLGEQAEGVSSKVKIQQVGSPCPLPWLNSFCSFCLHKETNFSCRCCRSRDYFGAYSWCVVLMYFIMFLHDLFIQFFSCSWVEAIVTTKKETIQTKNPDKRYFFVQSFIWKTAEQLPEWLGPEMPLALMARQYTWF